jgi:hypothetical protein
VEYVGLAAVAYLAFMSLSAKKIGLVYGLDLLRIEILLDNP